MENNSAPEIACNAYVIVVAFKMFLLTKYAVVFCQDHHVWTVSDWTVSEEKNWVDSKEVKMGPGAESVLKVVNNFFIHR